MIFSNFNQTSIVCWGSMWLLSSLLLWRLCCCYCCSVAKLCSTLWTPWTEACQAPLSSTISQSLLSMVCFMSIELVILSIHPILCCPLLLFSSIIPSFRVFSNELAFCTRGQSIGASASASVLPLNIPVWSSCCPRDSQESSPAPHFKSISSSMLSLLYDITLTSVHDYWKNRSFDLYGPLLTKWCLCF